MEGGRRTFDEITTAALAMEGSFELGPRRNEHRSGQQEAKKEYRSPRLQ